MIVWIHIIVWVYIHSQLSKRNIEIKRIQDYTNLMIFVISQKKGRITSRVEIKYNDFATLSVILNDSLRESFTAF